LPWCWKECAQFRHTRKTGNNDWGPGRCLQSSTGTGARFRKPDKPQCCSTPAFTTVSDPTKTLGPELTSRSEYRKDGRPKTKDLAQELYCQLPRELRNRVYSFCVEGAYDNEVIVRRAAESGSFLTLLIRERFGHQSYRWIEDPIVSTMNAQSLGLDAAREMIESYYWTRTFKFSDRELYLLGQFLQTDQFGLGVMPASYARRLKLHVQPYLWAQLRSAEARKAEEDRCMWAIESLGTMLTTRTEITIDIDLAEGLRDDMRCSGFTGRADRILRKIAQGIEGLREKGLRVNITYCQTWDE
jgi:hypothetical protein